MLNVLFCLYEFRTQCRILHIIKPSIKTLCYYDKYVIISNKYDEHIRFIFRKVYSYQMNILCYERYQYIGKYTGNKQWMLFSLHLSLYSTEVGIIIFLLLFSRNFAWFMTRYLSIHDEYKSNNIVLFMFSSLPSMIL